MPTGDFRYRLAMPATGPIPQEVAGCFTQPNEYGRYVISSGPYMFAGSDKLDATSCATIKAAGGISGFDGTTKLDLVRNPDYNKATDSPKARENLPDEFTFTVNSNTDDIFAQVGRGDLEDEVSGGAVPPGVARQYKGSNQLQIDSGDRTWYLMMNLTTPPFDDIHIRKAMNFVINGRACARPGAARSSASSRRTSRRTSCSATCSRSTPPTASAAGHLAKAKAEIKLSKYDTNHDGICDASACKNVFTITGARAAEKAFMPVLEQSLEGHRHHAQGSGPKDAYTRSASRARTSRSRPARAGARTTPIRTRSSAPNFDGRGDHPEGNTNRGLVGITPAQAKKLGVKGNITNMPSVNKDLDKCQQTLGDARLTCYAALDKKLITKVVPWVP